MHYEGDDNADEMLFFMEFGILETSGRSKLSMPAEGTSAFDTRSKALTLLSVRATKKVLYFKSMLVVLRDAPPKSI